MFSSSTLTKTPEDFSDPTQTFLRQFEDAFVKILDSHYRKLATDLRDSWSIVNEYVAAPATGSPPKVVVKPQSDNPVRVTQIVYHCGSANGVIQLGPTRLIQVSNGFNAVGLGDGIILENNDVRQFFCGTLGTDGQTITAVSAAYMYLELIGREVPRGARYW